MCALCVIVCVCAFMLCVNAPPVIRRGEVLCVRAASERRRRRDALDGMELSGGDGTKRGGGLRVGGSLHKRIYTIHTQTHQFLDYNTMCMCDIVSVRSCASVCELECGRVVGWTKRW